MKVMYNLIWAKTIIIFHVTSSDPNSQQMQIGYDYSEKVKKKVWAISMH